MAHNWRAPQQDRWAEAPVAADTPADATTGAPGHTEQRRGKRGPKAGTPPARRGGQAVREKYGPEFYRRIGAQGGRAAHERYGGEFYSAIGRKGGERTRERKGSAFYAEIGRRGGARGKGRPKLSAQDRALRDREQGFTSNA